MHKSSYTEPSNLPAAALNYDCKQQGPDHQEVSMVLVSFGNGATVGIWVGALVRGTNRGRELSTTHALISRFSSARTGIRRKQGAVYHILLGGPIDGSQVCLTPNTWGPQPHPK